jgi:RHS repeat-associated protein
VGEGFDWQPGFIERRYKPCGKDTGGSSLPKGADQCWATDNAVLSLGPHSGELIKVGDERWVLRSHDGTRVERKTGTPDADGDGDDNGEYWVVTAVDGTRYFFGRNRLPGWTSGQPETNATWTAPVYGNHAGEPCNTTSAKWCQQAWRWNLDHVVDASGNTVSYWYAKEKNNYQRAQATLTPYTRSGYLQRIDYGTRADTAYGTAPMQVVVETADRCVTSSCATHNGTNWPDTPWDMECKAGVTNCRVAGPSFWSTKRLRRVVTRVGGRDVESWTLQHSFPDPGDSTRAGLWLTGIDHAGHVGTTTTVPRLTFTGHQLPNRVDATDDLPAMNWWRMKSIVTESGLSVDVTYEQSDNQTCVKGSRMPSAAHSNTLRCYPVRWKRAGTDTTEWFHKYVVASVATTDLALPSNARSPRTITRYTYLGDPAWHYTDDDGLIEDRDKTWSVWRGYGRVRTVAGDPGEQQRSETVYFRGMDGDKQLSSTRSVTLPASGGAPAAADEDAYAGMAREEIAYHGQGDGDVLEAEVFEPWQSRSLASRTIDGVTVHSRVVKVGASRTRTALDGGRGWRTATTRTTFDDDGLPVREEDLGDDAVPDDQACTLTTYARNESAWLISYPQRTQKFAVDCGRALAGGLTEADVVSDERTSYDQAAYGVAPTAGLASRTEALVEWPSRYVVISRATHDAVGRVTESWDVRGNRTQTRYTPATGGPVTATAQVNHLGWETTTLLEPAWGSPRTTTDPNGRVTTLAHDGLGRLTAVWLPGRATTASANQRFDYLVRNNGPTVVTSHALNPAGAFVTTFALHDAHLRPRQTQAAASGVDGQRIVTDTLYDSVGRAVTTNHQYVATGTPGTTLIQNPADALVPGQTRTTYDGAGRVTASTFYVQGERQWVNRTAYGGDRTDVTPPAGGTATSTVVDAQGRTVELRQYRGAAPSGASDATTYVHDRKGRLTAVTDPAGNRQTFAYDLLGRTTSVDHPDKGRMATTYNDAGDVLTSTDARGAVLAYVYDSLGRRTGLHDGSPTGPVRARWTFDLLADGTPVRGRPVGSTRYVGTDTYTDEVRSVDAAYRPTSRRVSVAAAETGVSGAYDYAYSYAADGSPTTVRLPRVGDLPTETLAIGYTGLSQADTLTTNLPGTAVFLVNRTSYTAYGELAVIGRRHDTGRWLDTKREYAFGTRRMVNLLAKRETEPSLVADVRYDHDPAGNIIKVADVPVTGPADTQCLAYDHLRRLTEAWTPGSGDCGAARSTGALGGPAPYWQSFTYDVTGNRRQVTDRTPTASVTRDYAYPAAGQAQPHTLRSVRTGSATAAYTYDATGNTLTQPNAAHAWDAEGHLVSTTQSGGRTTTYLYDANGSRLVRRDPDGTRTLYLPEGQEVRARPASTAAGTRYYTHAGEVVGVRTAAGLDWLVNDHQGTALATVDADTQAVTSRRQKPFGEPRGATTAWPVDRGFVGGTLDPSGTIHLGAREYDAPTGRFLSVDPVVDHNDPQQMHGYGYANSTPVTMSDPTGLKPWEGDMDVPRSSCTGSCSVYRDHYTKKQNNCRGSCAGYVPHYTRVAASKRRPPPIGLSSTHRYRNGTVLNIYQDGTVTINSFVLPEGHPDPEELAEVVDRYAKYQNKAGKHLHPMRRTVDAILTACHMESVICGRRFRESIVAARYILREAFPRPENWWRRNGDTTTGLVGLGGLVACFVVTAGWCGVIGAVTAVGALTNSYYQNNYDGPASNRRSACFLVEVLAAGASTKIPAPITKGSSTPWTEYTMNGAMAAAGGGVTATLIQACYTAR